MVFESDLNTEILRDAFQETAQYRGSYHNIKTNGQDYIKMIEESDVLARLWEQYRFKNEYASELLLRKITLVIYGNL